MESDRTSSRPAEDLLRTLASVPVSSRILDLACGRGRHTEPLLRLGFPVHACDPRPEAVQATRDRVRDLVEDVDSCVRVSSLEALEGLDATFDWVVADGAEAYLEASTDLNRVFRYTRDVLTPGGWLYITLPAVPSDTTAGGSRGNALEFTEEQVESARTETDFSVARDLARTEPGDGARWQALYRRVDPEGRV